MPKTTPTIRRAGLFAVGLLLLTSPARFAPAGFSWAVYGHTDPAASISAEQISKHIEFLASDKLQGRRAGSPGADEAAHYIADRFRRYGLAPASSSGFLEPFSFVSGVRLGPANACQLKIAGSTRALIVGDDFMPLAFSSGERVAAPVVFVGYGISAPELQYDNYGADVTGKAVLVMRGSPDGDNPHGRFADYTAPGREVQFKTLKAREKGARGVIFISDEEDFHQDRLSRLQHDLNFLDAGIPAVIISREAARSMLASAGASISDAEKRARDASPSLSLDKTSIEFKTDVVKIESQSANVVGMIKGTDPVLSSEYVVIGAHYDHLGLGGPESLAQNPHGEIHHGADDNASGTSAVLELARAIAAERGKLKRTIVFASFSGEEEGLLGSAAYTKNPPVPLASTVAMINMDMIGRLRDDALIIGGAGTSPAWKPLLDKINSGPDKASGGAQRFKLALQDDGYGPSDHQSFYVRDIPVLFFFTGSHPDYHKPSDTADKINAEGIRQIAEFVRLVALSVANEPERIAFTRVKSTSRPTGGGFRVYLGTVPNYSDQSDGLKLDGVRPGSPAERAGLRAGDIVVKLGQVPVKNVYDYTYALGDLKAGQEVEVVIRRDNQPVTLKITPDKRQ
jgi:Zn-dependent M28 family amino/carboxypeptidase